MNTSNFCKRCYKPLMGWVLPGALLGASASAVRLIRDGDCGGDATAAPATGVVGIQSAVELSATDPRNPRQKSVVEACKATAQGAWSGKRCAPP